MTDYRDLVDLAHSRSSVLFEDYKNAVKVSENALKRKMSDRRRDIFLRHFRVSLRALSPNPSSPSVPAPTPQCSGTAVRLCESNAVIAQMSGFSPTTPVGLVYGGVGPDRRREDDQS